MFSLDRFQIFIYLVTYNILIDIFNSILPFQIYSLPSLIFLSLNLYVYPHFFYSSLPFKLIHSATIKSLTIIYSLPFLSLISKILSSAYIHYFK